MAEQQAQNPLKGVFWMLVTGLCFVAVTALVKMVGRLQQATCEDQRYGGGVASSFVAPFSVPP